MRKIKTYQNITLLLIEHKKVLGLQSQQNIWQVTSLRLAIVWNTKSFIGVWGMISLKFLLVAAAIN